MNAIERTWQTPVIERLDVGATLGGVLANADGSGLANSAFPNPS